MLRTRGSGPTMLLIMKKIIEGMLIDILTEFVLKDRRGRQLSPRHGSRSPDRAGVLRARGTQLFASRPKTIRMIALAAIATGIFLLSHKSHYPKLTHR